ncbi:MAG: aminotransferase class V-fold PLP-dependent enzyme, partial [Planctomycetota bacterium]
MTDRFSEMVAKHALLPPQIRDDFPILTQTSESGADLVYLDNAASTQRPTAVLDAMDACYRSFYSNVHRGIHTMSERSTAAYESARRIVAKFLNADSECQVIFTAGTTAAINTVARSWGDQNIDANDTILLTIAEHHANIVPWQQLSQRTGCNLVFLPVDAEGTIDDETMRTALQQHQPKLLACSAVSNVLGTVFPVARWVTMARELAGCVVLVDAAQSIPHQPMDVQAMDADFLIFSGHKICGPSGIGILYGRESLLDSMPPFLGGGAMIREVTTSGFTTASLPEKFEAGTPGIVQMIGLGVAIDYMLGHGMEA